MSAYAYLTVDGLITKEPCKLLSVIITVDGGGPGKVEIYNGRAAVTNDRALTLLCSANQSRQFLFGGLEFGKGLYVDFVEKADYVTIEWEPHKRC